MKEENRAKFSIQFFREDYVDDRATQCKIEAKPQPQNIFTEIAKRFACTTKQIKSLVTKHYKN